MHERSRGESGVAWLVGSSTVEGSMTFAKGNVAVASNAADQPRECQSKMIDGTIHDVGRTTSSSRYEICMSKMQCTMLQL